jgi:acrylyl-CoA reductase (NADPH)
MAESLAMPQLRAFRLTSEDGRLRGATVEMATDDLMAGDVVIRGDYSSVNYKDALAATGTGKIVRRLPLNGGIDVAGCVESSVDPRFRPGERVLVTGYDLGVAHDGGFATVVRVPGDWVVAIPDGLSSFEAMTYGTAGFTAGLAIIRLERNGLRPGEGPVIVTGATGGVGSIAVGSLSALGYDVTAVTGKGDAHDYLRRMGASTILPRAGLEMGTKPLEKARWAGAVDAVGGDMLAWLTRTTKEWGGIASTGLTGGIELHTTVMPFILRGVSLIGVDSVTCPMEMRREVWRRLATDMRPTALASVATEIGFDGLPAAVRTLLAGEARGRFVVSLQD